MYSTPVYMLYLLWIGQIKAIDIERKIREKIMGGGGGKGQGC